MNKIDGGAFDPAQAGRLVQWASVREDGWRHALESAFMALDGGHSSGMADRHRASNPCVAASSSPSQQGSGSSRAGAQVAGGSPERYLPAVEALGAAPTDTPSVGGLLNGGGGLIRGPRAGEWCGGIRPASTEAPRPDDTLPQARLAWSAYARAALESTDKTTEVATSSAAADGAPAAQLDGKLFRQNIFIERTQQGAVLWIRHPNAGSVELQSMLSALIQHTRVAGVPLCGVRINGMPVDIGASAVPPHPDAAQPLPSPILSRRPAHGD